MRDLNTETELTTLAELSAAIDALIERHGEDTKVGMLEDGRKVPIKSALSFTCQRCDKVSIWLASRKSEVMLHFAANNVNTPN